MARERRPAIPQTKRLEDEIRSVVAKYVEYNKARKRFNRGEFFSESDVSKTLWTRMVMKGRHSITLDSVVRLLDSVGMKLVIVPKDDPEIVKRTRNLIRDEAGTE